MAATTKTVGGAGSGQTPAREKNWECAVREFRLFLRQGDYAAAAAVASENHMLKNDSMPSQVDRSVPEDAIRALAEAISEALLSCPKGALVQHEIGSIAKAMGLGFSSRAQQLGIALACIRLVEGGDAQKAEDMIRLCTASTFTRKKDMAEPALLAAKLASADGDVATVARLFDFFGLERAECRDWLMRDMLEALGRRQHRLHERIGSDRDGAGPKDQQELAEISEIMARILLSLAGEMRRQSTANLRRMESGVGDAMDFALGPASG